MNRMPLYGAAVLAALVPAAVGLWGNGSFSQAVPVNVPASAQIASLDDHPDARPTPSPSATPKSRAAEIGDDHGGDTPRSQRTEPGDDHGGSSGPRSSGPSGGHDAGSGHDAGDDHGGSGSGGHGSDD